MKNSQKGFAVGAVIGIIAILPLLGAAAYVATNNEADTATTTDETATSSQASTTVGGALDLGLDIKADTEADLNLEATTSVGADASTTVGGAGVNANVGGTVSY